MARPAVQGNVATMGGGQCTRNPKTQPAAVGAVLAGLGAAKTALKHERQHIGCNANALIRNTDFTGRRAFPGFGPKAY